MNKLTRRNFLKAFAVVAVAGPAVAVAKPPVRLVNNFNLSTVSVVSTPDGSELQDWQKRFIRVVWNYSKDKGVHHTCQESDDMVNWCESLLRIEKGQK